MLDIESSSTCSSLRRQTIILCCRISVGLCCTAVRGPCYAIEWDVPFHCHQSCPFTIREEIRASATPESTSHVDVCFVSLAKIPPSQGQSYHATPSKLQFQAENDQSPLPISRSGRQCTYNLSRAALKQTQSQQICDIFE